MPARKWYTTAPILGGGKRTTTLEERRLRGEIPGPGPDVWPRPEGMIAYQGYEFPPEPPVRREAPRGLAPGETVEFGKNVLEYGREFLGSLARPAETVARNVPRAVRGEPMEYPEGMTPEEAQDPLLAPMFPWIGAPARALTAAIKPSLAFGKTATRAYAAPPLGKLAREEAGGVGRRPVKGLQTRLQEASDALKTGGAITPEENQWARTELKKRLQPYQDESGKQLDALNKAFKKGDKERYSQRADVVLAPLKKARQRIEVELMEEAVTRRQAAKPSLKVEAPASGVTDEMKDYLAKILAAKPSDPKSVATYRKIIDKWSPEHTQKAYNEWQSVAPVKPVVAPEAAPAPRPAAPPTEAVAPRAAEIPPQVAPQPAKAPLTPPVAAEVPPLPLFSKEVTGKIIEQGRQVDLAIRLGWLDKEGQLTELGKIIISGDLSDLSPNIRPLAIKLRQVLETVPKLPAAAPAGAGGPPARPAAGGVPPVPPAGPVTPTTPPAPIRPGPLGENIIGLRPIETGLTRREMLANLVRRTIGKPFKAVEESPLSTPAMKERARVRPIVQVQANNLAAQAQAQIDSAFKVDKKGRLLDMAGIDPEVPGAPTLQDVAARLPRYEAALSPQQKQVLADLRDSFGRYKSLLDEVGVEVPSRPDVMEGGFYLPRGRAEIEGADEVIKVAGGGRRGGKRGFERPALFKSQAEGIEKGFEYAPLPDALKSYANDAGMRSVDAHIANYFKGLTDEAGNLIGETPKMRLLRQNPQVAAKMEALKKQLVRLQGLSSRLTDRQMEVIQRWQNDPTFDDLDTLLEGLATMKAGKKPGMVKTEVQQALQDTRQAIQALQPEYKVALRRAQTASRGEGYIDLPGLQGWAWPDEMANAANKVLQGEGPTKGYMAPVLNVANAFNNLYRGFKATLDDSALGIQGLLGMAGDQKAYASALKVNLQAWGNHGDRILGKYIVDFNKRARTAGHLVSDEWVKRGLRLGGADTEFELGKGTVLGRLPGVRHANRAFGYFGDSLRLGWADNLLGDELRKGRTLAEIASSGDMERIAKVANNMTGWTEGKAFGSMGDLVLFAPKWLQSRVEVLAKAGAGLRPGASIDQRIARQNMLKLIGSAVSLTVAANYLLGEETDFRPVVDGKRNSKFIRIKWAGRYWSLLGPWDSLEGQIIWTALGRPDKMVRSLSSGVTTLGWDVLGGATYEGKRVRDNPGQFGAYLLSLMAPFAAGDMPEVGERLGKGIQEGKPIEVLAGGVQAGAQVTGFKSFPESPREKVTERLFPGKTYDELSPLEKDKVNKSPEVEKEEAEWEAKAYTDPKALVEVSMQNYETANESIEAELSKAVKAGASGKVLKDFIQTAKERRWQTAQTTFNPAVEAEMKKGKDQKLKDILKEQYWAADAPQDMLTGKLDFKARDKTRADVLARAKAAGIEEKFILERVSPWKDPAVAKVVAELEQAQETLRPYWRIEDNMVETLKKAGKGDVQPLLDEWRLRQGMPKTGDNLQRIREIENKNLYKLWQRQVDSWKLKARFAEEAIDDALVEWYGLVPVRERKKK